MDDLLIGLPGGAIAWRDIIGTIAGGFTAWVLQLIGIGNPAVAFILMFLGASIGVVRGARLESASAAAAASQTQPQPVANEASLLSRSLHFCFLCMVAGVWAALVESVAGVTAAAIAAVVAPVVIVPLLASLSGQALSLRWFRVAICASLVGFGVPHIAKCAGV